MIIYFWLQIFFGNFFVDRPKIIPIRCFNRSFRFKTVIKRLLIVFNTLTIQKRFFSEIWIMNPFYDQFDGPKWIYFTGANSLTDNEDILVIFFGRITSPKVSVQGSNNFCQWKTLASSFHAILRYLSLGAFARDFNLVQILVTFDAWLKGSRSERRNGCAENVKI